MANCGVSSGNAIQCRNFMPGIKRFYLAPFFSGTTSSELLTYTVDSNNVITAATMSTGTFYTFDLTRESGDYQEAIHVNPTNGTVSYEGTFSAYLANYSTALRNKIVAAAKGRMYLIFEDRNGQFFLCGTDGTGTNPSASMGVDMGESTATPGKAYVSDSNGYNLVFNFTEKLPPIEISSSVVASISTPATN